MYMDTEEGSCHPSLNTLAAETGRGKRQVRDALDELARAGYLGIERGKPGYGNPNHYTAKVPSDERGSSRGNLTEPRERFLQEEPY
jgi:DNA-binding FadR family transcriptional regulator